MSGLQNVRSLVHENLIPALERAAVILSRLLGLARFHDGQGDDVGFGAAQASRALDILAALTLVANRVLLGAMDELDHFAVFSGWLRHEIDRQASGGGGGPGDGAGVDISEKEATMDHGRVLAYLRHYLVRSPLALFLADVGRDDYSADWQHVEDGPSLLDMLDRQLRREEQGLPHMKALPRLEFLVAYLTSRSQKMFDAIAENLKKSVRFGLPTRLETGGAVAKFATRLCPGPDAVRTCSTEHDPPRCRARLTRILRKPGYPTPPRSPKRRRMNVSAPLSNLPPQHQLHTTNPLPPLGPSPPLPHRHFHNQRHIHHAIHQRRALPPRPRHHHHQ